jgi:hypothetical protein
VIPDLLIYSLQLAKLYNINLQEAFLERLIQNKDRVSNWKKETEISGNH